jgi:hypothetical protein
MTTQLTPVFAFLLACGGADRPAADTAPADPAPAAVPAGHLAIVPFVLTMTTTRQDGTEGVIVMRGDAEGVVSVEREGETRARIQLSADGTIRKLGESTPEHTTRLNPDGTLQLDGETMPRARLGDDGTVYRDGEAILKFDEGGAVVDITGEALVSRVTMNGKVVSESRTAMTLEGGDQARRLAGLVLVLMHAPAKARPKEPVEQSSEAPAAVGPMPERR